MRRMMTSREGDLFLAAALLFLMVCVGDLMLAMALHLLGVGR